MGLICGLLSGCIAVASFAFFQNDSGITPTKSVVFFKL
jgi:hypothetical protein